MTSPRGLSICDRLRLSAVIGTFLVAVVTGSCQSSTAGAPSESPSPLASSTETVVPDVIGLSVQDALELLAGSGLRGKAQGNGSVVMGQSPEPGSKIEPQGIVVLRT